MKRKVQLYIAGRRVDLGDDSWILYNWTRENLANPTAVVNSSSHQVQLPGTCRNNSVFGAAFRLDRKTVFGVRYDGTQFDPTRKTPFTLYNEDGTVLEAGYCRLDKVNSRSRIHAYTVTLYGGLGSFFYALANTEDGKERTLRDLIWKDKNGNDVTDFAVTPVASDTVRDAWYHLAGSTPAATFWNIVNFAPAYNGLPKDFDASHAIVTRQAFKNVMDEYLSDGLTYTYKAGVGCALLTFQKPHTEWEVCDLRWNLQRPVVSVKAFITAICDSRNNGGYTVTLDPTFFRDDNPDYADMWWTLPLIATEDRLSQECLNNVLAASKSPMAYLVSYCKIWGLLFLYDAATKTVRIVTRATFYGEGALDPIDLTTRVDLSQDTGQNPVLADKRWYQMGEGGKGEFVEQYERDYGRGYAIQRIDTGYEFDASTKVLTQDIVFQDAAEVQESNRLFASCFFDYNASNRLLYFPFYETVMEELWNGDTSISFIVRTNSIGTAFKIPQIVYDTPDTPGADWLPKLQLHQAENKDFDGRDVLVYFAGMMPTPVVTGDQRKRYYITEDHGAMEVLAGALCWDLTGEGPYVTSLPSFRRVVLSDRYIVDSLEWGMPLARPVLGISYPTGEDNSVFGKWWKAYLADRYNADTRVLTCMADLRGLPVGQALLRRFYWLDGTLWTMNAIRNHSLTSWDLTEIELVKVQDRRAYDTGPGSVEAHYLRISPAAASFAFLTAGETLTFTVRSTSAWTLGRTQESMWLDISDFSGPAGTTVITIAAPANTGTDRRNASVTLTNEDGDIVRMTFSQDPRPADTISVSPSAIAFPGNGGQLPVAVTASGAWALQTEDVPSWLTAQTSSAGITFSAGGNGATARSASVRVYLVSDPTTFVTISVTQEAGSGGTGSISLLDLQGNDNATLPASAGYITLVATVPAGASWSAAESPDVNWTAISPSSGTGTGNFAVAVSANTGAARQVAIVLSCSGFEPVTFYLHQEAGAPAQTLTLLDSGSHDSATAPAAGQTITLNVGGTGGASWSLTSYPSFVSFNRTSGTGNGSVTMYVNANTGAARDGAVVVTCNGQTATFYLHQEAASSGSDYYANIYRYDDFSERNWDDRSAAAHLEDGASVGSNGNWSCATSESWIHPTYLQYYPWTGRSGNGYIYYDIDANPGAARQGVIRCTCAETGVVTEFYIYQEGGAQASLTASFDETSIDSSAQTVTLRIVASSGLAWSITNVSSGLTPSTLSGTGSTTMSVSVSAATTSRTLSLIVRSSAGSLSAIPTLSQACPAVVDYLRVTPFGTIDVPYDFTNATFGIDCSSSWRVVNEDADVSLDRTTGSGDGGRVVATLPVNPSSLASRSFVFLFETTAGPYQSVQVTIVQAAAPAFLRVTPFGVVSISYRYVSTPFVVESSVPWEAVCNVQGVIVTPASGSAGTFRVDVIHEPNDTDNIRTIPVTFQSTPDATLSQSATILQTPNIPETFIIDTDTLEFGNEAATNGVLLSASDEWTAGTSDSWITVSPASGYSGNNQEVTVRVSPNTGAARTGTVTFQCGVLRRTVTVSQAAGSAMDLSVYPTAVTVRQGRPATVTVFSSRAWHVESLSPYFWVNPTPLSGSGSVNGETLTIATRGYAGAQRSYSLKIYDDVSGNYVTVTVTQNANT